MTENAIPFAEIRYAAREPHVPNQLSAPTGLLSDTLCRPLRFIEYMDVGATNGWRMNEVLPSAQVIERINAEFPLTANDPNYIGETAERWRYGDGAGEIGVISSVTQAFCHSPLFIFRK